MKILQIDENTACKLYVTASDEFKQLLENTFGVDFFIPYPNLDEPVEVAGILWGEYLTPSLNCNAHTKFNKEVKLHYFNNKTSAMLHAFEQNLKLPNKYQFQQLYDRTIQRDEIVRGIKYKVFTDTENGKELWMIYGGYYSPKDREFRFVGEHGYYWSKSVHTTICGYYMHFKDEIYPQLNNNREFCFPIRCVIS